MFGLTLITTKKYETLLSDNQVLAGEYNDLKNEYDELEKKLEGDRVCGQHCKNCKYGIEEIIYSTIFPPTIKYTCELELKCKDFERLER